MVKAYYSVDTYRHQESLSYLSRRAGKQVTAQMEAAFAKLDISFVQYAVLMQVHEKVAITASDICQNLQHDTGALARIIEDLESRGLLTRERSETDRRRVEIELTEKGEALRRQLVATVVTFLDDVLEEFTREEADTLARLLTRLNDRLAQRQKAKD